MNYQCRPFLNVTVSCSPGRRPHTLWCCTGGQWQGAVRWPPKNMGIWAVKWWFHQLEPYQTWWFANVKYPFTREPSPWIDPLLNQGWGVTKSGCLENFGAARSHNYLPFMFDKPTNRLTNQFCPNPGRSLLLWIARSTPWTAFEAGAGDRAFGDQSVWIRHPLEMTWSRNHVFGIVGGIL